MLSIKYPITVDARANKLLKKSITIWIWDSLSSCRQ